MKFLLSSKQPMWKLIVFLNLSFAPPSFVVGSLLCSDRFFSGQSSLPLSSKTSISKFQFDQELGRRRTLLWMCYLQIINIYLFGQMTANFQQPGFRQIQLDLYVISENEKCDHYSFHLSLFSSLRLALSMFTSPDLVLDFL